MRKVTSRTRTRTRTEDAPAPKAKSRSRDAWHIAADWVEVFAPVLWDHVEPQLRQGAEAAVARREHLRAEGIDDDKPLTIVIDSIPVHKRFTDMTNRRSSRAMYSVLVIAEIEWRDGPSGIERQQHLRLARAYPTADHLAWKLMFAELGYTPDVVVSDCDAAQIKAVNEFYENEPVRPLFVPSLFHIRQNVEQALLSTPRAQIRIGGSRTDELRSELDDHLGLLSRKHLTSMRPDEWTGWWDELEALLMNLGAPLERIGGVRRLYELRVADVLPTVSALPHLPLSTGGVEVFIHSRIERMLTNRQHAFTNIERTNRLFDLVVCDDHGLFDDMTNVIRVLRADSKRHHGWSVPLRLISDPQVSSSERYSSLRDVLLTREIAAQKGIA